MRLKNYQQMSEYQQTKEIVKEEDIQFLAESAYADACAPGNPKDASVEDIIGLI